MWPMSHALYPGLNNRPGSPESQRTWYGNNRSSNVYASSQLSNNRYSRYSYAAPSVAESTGEPLADLIQRSQRMLSVLTLAAAEEDDDSLRKSRDHLALYPEGGQESTIRYSSSQYSQDHGQRLSAWSQWSNIGPPRWSRPPTGMTNNELVYEGREAIEQKAYLEAQLSRDQSFGSSAFDTDVGPCQKQNLGSLAKHCSEEDIKGLYRASTPTQAALNAAFSVESVRGASLPENNTLPTDGSSDNESRAIEPSQLDFGQLRDQASDVALQVDPGSGSHLTSNMNDTTIPEPTARDSIDISTLTSHCTVLIPAQPADILVYHMQHDQLDFKHQPLPWAPGQPLETLRDKHKTDGDMTISGLTMVSPDPPPHALTTNSRVLVPNMINLKGEPTTTTHTTSSSSAHYHHQHFNQPSSPSPPPSTHTQAPLLLLHSNTLPISLPRLALTTLALSIAVFLVAMDVNVIATAIPHITADFKSLNDIGWYGSAFLLTTCACQVPYGRLYTVFPSKLVFLSAILVFMLGSLACALAGTSGVFVVGRGVQGMGTAGILSGGLIIIAQVVPLRLRGLLSGVIAAMEGVAMISAPVVGGVLTDRLSWRWCFWINLPIGGFVLVVVLVCLNVPPSGEKGDGVGDGQGEGKGGVWETVRRLDLLGAVALLPPVVCTILALHYAGNGYSWGSMNVVLLFVLAFVLFAIFAWTQHVNADVAMIPWRLVKQRSVLSAFWFILCISSALVVITYFLPLWFQTVKGEKATQAGIGILPMLVGVIIGVLGSGALVAWIGYYTPFMLLSSVLMPVGVGLLTTITPETGRGCLIAYPAIFGLGVGVGFQQPLIGVQAVVSKADIPIGTSIVVFGQTFGAAIIIAVGESIFSNRLGSNIERYLGITDIDTRHVLGNGDSGSSLISRLRVDEIPLLLRAVNDSLTQTFYLSLVMGGLSIIGAIFMEWKSVKGAKLEEKPAVVECGDVQAERLKW